MKAAALAALALAPLVASPSAIAEPVPFTVHDMVSMDRLSGAALSPGGDRIVFVRRVADVEANGAETDLWAVGVDGGGLRRLTSAKGSDSSPVWAPDGKSVLFLSSRSGSSQVWRLPLGGDGGEAAQVTDLPVGISGFVLSPDGRRLAFTAEVYPDCDTLACTAERDDGKAESPRSGRLYERLMVRHWDTWKDGKQSRLFVAPIGEGGEAGDPVQVSRGLDADVPVKPFGGSEEIAFTPDGLGVVFAAREAGSPEAWSTDVDLYHAPADGSAPPEVLTDDNPAYDNLPVFSPDGRTLAWVAMERPGFEADRLRLVLRDWPDGEPRLLADGWDRSVSSFTFSRDGGTILAIAQDLGNRSLFAVDVASGAVRRLIGEGTVRSVADAGERLVVAIDHLRSPVELYSVAPDGSERRAITDINGDRLARLELGEPEQFTFSGWNDETVYGWLVKPAGFDPAKRYPLAFLIHGGPQGSFSNQFHYRWNPQVYAGAGYAAVMIDFHGSTGYGQAFTDSISGDWGGKPLVDLQKGLAETLRRYPWIDGERACALGASYGGYMINWLAGNWLGEDGGRPFDCLVNHDGVFDNRMMYYATEELWFPEWEHGGPYYAAAEGHEKHNPVHHVDRWATPMLVIHGALDFRVPETQSLGAFTALQRQGIPSKLLWYPDENHWVLSIANSMQWHEVVLDWLAEWTFAEK